MLELERQEWRSRAFSRAEMRRQVAAGRAAVGTLVAEDRLVGFAVATPGWLARGATLNNVLIDPAYRGRGLVWPLLAAVERELGTRGFATLVIDARVDNGFADAIERRYGARARVLARDHPSPYGAQRTIAVELSDPSLGRPRRASRRSSSLDR